MSENNNKKVLAEKLKVELNSPEYVAMPDLISGGDYHGCLLALDLKGKDGWIWDRSKKGRDQIRQSQLEQNDWKEIINLIEKRNQEREQNWQTKRKKIEKKLNSQSGLYYYWGKWGSEPKKADGWHPNKDMRGYCCFLGGQGNGLNYHLYIAESHPILDSFSFQPGFYLINDNKPVEKNIGSYEGGFACYGGETNPGNWQKYIEVGDQITITPYEVENNSELPENWKKELEPKWKKPVCDTCQKRLGKEPWGGYDDNFYIIKRYHGKANVGSPAIWACLDCYPTKKAEYLQNYAGIYERFKEENGDIDYRLIKAERIDCYANKKDQNGQILKQQDCSHCQPWKWHEIPNSSKISNPNNNEEIKQIATFLLRYFQEHNIKKIELNNDKLIITHNNNNNNNEIVSAKDNREFQNVENYLLQNNKKTLNLEEVKELLNNSKSPSNSTPTSSKKDYTPYLIGGTVGLGLVALIVFGFCLLKGEKKNKN